MGRPRTRGDLPKGVYLNRGTFFYIDDGRWRTLGNERAAALERYQGIVWARQNWSASKQRSFNSSLFSSTRRRAARKGIHFDLTLADVEYMIAASGGACTVTGIEFDFRRASGKRRRPWIPSIDRIVPSNGYARGNCRIVCSYLNTALNEHELATFVSVSERLRKLTGKRKILGNSRIIRKAPSAVALSD